VAGGAQALTPRRRPLVAAAVALAAVYLIWGSTYLGISVAVRSLPPLLMLSLRFLTAGGILYAWSVRRGDRDGDRPGRREWRTAFIVGGLLLFVESGAVAWAEHRHLDTGLAALICATIPLWIVGFDGVLEGRRLAAGELGGLGLGLAGVAALLGPSVAGLDLPAVFAVLVGTLAWAGGSLYARRAPRPRRTHVGTGMEMIAAGLLLAVAGVAGGELRDVRPEHLGLATWGAMAYLIVFGTLAYTAYGWLLRNVSTTVASTYGYVNPIVAVLLGWLVLGEPLTIATLLSGAMIVGAVALIITVPKRREPEPIPLPARATADVSRLAA
jgi:drug/metabolite transporter (DMT)-like permease